MNTTAEQRTKTPLAMNGNTLQRRLTRSKAWRHFVRAYCAEIGARDHSAVINEAMTGIMEACSDNQIRSLCRGLLYCEDLKPAEAQEILSLIFF